MKKGLPIGAILLITLLLLSGCTQTGIEDTTSQAASNTPTNQSQTNDGTSANQQDNQSDLPGSAFGENPAYIGEFTIFLDNIEENLVVRFSFTDEQDNYTYNEGTAALRIVDADKQEVYSSNINASKADFKKFTIQLTGKNFLAAEYKIPLTQIKKSQSGNTGTAYLEFNTNKGTRFEEISTLVYGLPTYSTEELEQLAEEEYKAKVITINQPQSKGNWEVAVISAGFFTSKAYWEEKEYFRIDFKVKNKGTEKEYFSPSSMVLLDNKGNQYEDEYGGGTLDTYTEIYPGVSKEGYILFKAIPKDTTSAKLLFGLGRDEQYKAYNWEYNLPLIK